MGRQVRWPAERQYAEETKTLVHRFIHQHPFEASGQGKWNVAIPQGNYVVIQSDSHYTATYHPFLGGPVQVVRVNYRTWDDDAWCRVVIAVTRDANRRMQ